MKKKFCLFFNIDIDFKNGYLLIIFVVVLSCLFMDCSFIFRECFFIIDWLNCFWRLFIVFCRLGRFDFI